MNPSLTRRSTSMVVLGALLASTSCMPDSQDSDEHLGAIGEGLGTAYYVDPVNGADVLAGGTSAAPWKTVAYAIARIASKPAAQQLGTILNLRGGQIYPSVVFPSNLNGSAAEPIVVQPWLGAVGGSQGITFDAGLPALQVQNNNAWEPVPAAEGGVPGEWRTKLSIPTNGTRYAWGQLMASQNRLINYEELGDLRAQNESFVSVPLSDPRPALGPSLSNLTHKFPFVYLGPGIAFEFDNAAHTSGRIHARLAPTHFNAPGMIDYAGEMDPNRLALSIANKSAVALTVLSQHIVFNNVVAQNGGQTTLVIGDPAGDVTFDHCKVYGARIGMRVGLTGGGVTFRHCTFDGGLAPWTTRADVKESYNYVGPPDCPKDGDGRCFNGLGSSTSDILVSHTGNDSLYDHCTFRRGHDGIQIEGQRVEIRSSLFEDMNDEVIRFFHQAVDVQVHENLVRQALVPLSFSDNPTGGPLYIYRNVFDQRVPTRGERVLRPDADPPWIWRYGQDFKNGAMPELHVYQNTFVSSGLVDKDSWVSQLFRSDPTAQREYMNNIHLVLDADLPVSRVPSPGTPAHTAGNVWFRYQSPNSAIFSTATTSYSDLASLHADRPDWEVGSLYQDPQLANFTDEYFLYADPQSNAVLNPVAGGLPNTDYRPLANVGGVALPPGLPDVPAYAGVLHAGALPANAPPLAVGVDGVTVLPVPGTPVARAGNDQTVMDADGDGFENVAFDGTASSDPEGGALTYAWSIQGRVVSTAAAPTLLLPEGKHVVRLVVTDPTGRTDSDAVVVRIVAPLPGDNRLANPGFESTDTSDWTLPPGSVLTAATGEVHSGALALKLYQSAAAQVVKQRVAVTPGATYVTSGWMKTQGLTPGVWSTLRADVLDSSGSVLETRMIQIQGMTSSYAYAEQVIVAGPTATAIEIVDTVDAGAGSGTVYLDDLRVRDRNQLTNGGFEVPSPDGSDQHAPPGWAFGRLGAISSTVSLAHGGRRSLELASQPAVDAIVTSQPFPYVSGRSYRVSAWVRTNGATVAPTFQIRPFSTAGARLSEITVAQALSEGHSTLVERTLSPADLQAGTASLEVLLTLTAGAPGTVHFDDFLVEMLP